MIKYFFSIFIICIFATDIFATPKELLSKLGDVNQWIGKVEPYKGNLPSNGPAYVLYGKYPTKLIYKHYIPVNPKKTYTLKIRFRSLDESLPASGYMGFELLDAKKRPILYQHVVIPNVPYSSVISAKKGGKQLVVKMVPEYLKLKKVRVVFNAKKDCSDIPNFDISPNCIKVEKTKDGNIKFTLDKALNKDYKPGTPIRIHTYFSVPMYYLTSGWMPAGNGKECVAVLNGVAKTTGAVNSQFWKGAAYARPFVWFGNWNRIPKTGAKLLVDSFSFTESSPKVKSTKK